MTNPSPFQEIGPEVTFGGTTLRQAHIGSSLLQSAVASYGQAGATRPYGDVGEFTAARLAEAGPSRLMQVLSPSGRRQPWLVVKSTGRTITQEEVDAALYDD